MTACRGAKSWDPDTLIIGVEAPIRNLDVRRASDANAVHVSTLLTQGLMDLDDQFNLQPSLAKSFEIREDREFRFELSTSQFFHNGQPVEAADVLASFQQASQPGSVPAASFSDLESMNLQGNTLVIRFKKPRAGFLKGEMPSIRIFPRRESQEATKHPIGSGPYEFVRREGRDLHFRRFEAFGGKKPRFGKITVRALQDPTTRYLSLLAGDIDILFNALAPSRVELAKKDSRLRVFEGPGSSFQYIGLQQRHPELSKPSVRQALMLAIDRQSLIQYKLKGLAKPATSVLPESNPYFDTSLPQWDQDISKARTLIEDSGWKQPRRLKLRSSTDRDVVSWLRVLQSDWAKIGVQVDIESTEFGHFFAAVKKGDFEAFSLRWTAIVDPDILFSIFHSSQVPPGRNRIFYKNSTVDKLLEEGRSTMDSKNRKEIYLQVQKQIARDLPYLPLWYASNVVVAQAYIHDFQLMPSGAWTGALYAQKRVNDLKNTPEPTQ